MTYLHENHFNKTQIDMQKITWYIFDSVQVSVIAESEVF